MLCFSADTGKSRIRADELSQQARYSGHNSNAFSMSRRDAHLHCFGVRVSVIYYFRLPGDDFESPAYFDAISDLPEAMRHAVPTSIWRYRRSAYLSRQYILRLLAGVISGRRQRSRAHFINMGLSLWWLRLSRGSMRISGASPNYASLYFTAGDYDHTLCGPLFQRLCDAKYLRITTMAIRHRRSKYRRTFAVSSTKQI